jgi:hypothetical protein
LLISMSLASCSKLKMPSFYPSSTAGPKPAYGGVRSRRT